MRGGALLEKTTLVILRNWTQRVEVGKKLNLNNNLPLFRKEFSFKKMRKV